MSDPKPPSNADGKNSIKPEKTAPAPANGSDNTPDMIEIGGVKGPEPTRYGDWEKQGRCIDF